MTARCCRSAPAGADVRAVELEPDGIDVAAVERVLAAGARPKLAHIIPNFQNPAGYTLSGEQARAAARARAAPTSSPCSRTTRTWRCGSRAARSPTMVSMDPETRRLRVVVLEDRVPRDPRRLPRRARGADRADRQARDEHVHLAEHGLAVDRLRVLPSPARSSARSRRSRRRSASARRRCARRCARELPDARFVAPQGGYFLWVDLPRGTDVGGAVRPRRPRARSSSSRAPTSCSRAASRACASRTRA